jgi:protein SCO1/2
VPENSPRFSPAWFLLLVPIALFVWYMVEAGKQRPARILPVFAPRHDTSGATHLVPSFSFTDQHGRSFTQDDLEGKIYVAEFFFTTCQSICPVMNDHLQQLYQKFSGEKRLHFVSHTVDPETDSVQTLHAYAESHGVVDDRWHFVTGEKNQLYRMARQGYLLDSGTPSSHEDDFVHTQNFALVDWANRLRGFYDGTDSLEMVRLEQDINVLLDEFEYIQKPGH